MIAKRSSVPGGPAMSVEDFLLQRSEEAAHRRVVTSGPDSAHRSNQPVVLQGLLEIPGPLLGKFKRSMQHRGVE